MRIDTEAEKFGRKIATEDYGSSRNLGGVVSDALKFYYNSRLNPSEKSNLLTDTEHFLINRVEDRVDEMGDKTVKRIGDLYARSSYESCLTSIMVEELLGDKFGQYAQHEIEKLRQKAAVRMKNRLERVEAKKLDRVIERNYELQKEVQDLKQKQVDFDDLSNLVEEQETAIEWMKNLITFLSKDDPNLPEKIRYFDEKNNRPKGL